MPSFVDPGLEKFLIDNGEISAKPIEEEGNPLLNLLFGFGPALLFIGFYIWMFRRMAQQGGGMAGLWASSKARRYDQEKDTKVTFNDVAGIDEAENELVEIVDFLKDLEEVHPLGRDRSERRSAGGRAGHRENPAREGGRGRGRMPFFSMSAGVRGDDRGVGAAGCGTFSSKRERTRPRSCSSTSSTPSVGRAGRWRSAVRASKSRL